MLVPGLHFLKEDEQLLVEGFTRRWTHNGPGRYVSPAFSRVHRRKAFTLGPTEYLHVRDTLTGELHSEIGPKLYFPIASEQVIRKLTAIPLKNNQYIKIIDNSSGVIRVEQGEGTVYLKPTEEVLTGRNSSAPKIAATESLTTDKITGRQMGSRHNPVTGPVLTMTPPEEISEEGIKTGINIDEHTAVLVRDTESGRLELIQEQQVFVPTAQQEILEVRRRILLQDHDTVVIKDNSGRYLFKRGSDAERAFFLDPYSELVIFHWSSGLHKDQKGLRITHIDSRPKFMWYEFEVRTQDNVELIIGITFFWQIVEVEAMVRTTDDPTGDVCSHARSAIMQSVSQVSLERFLAEFNAIVSEVVIETDDPFYAERGIRLRAVEVRSISCKDPATQDILQEVIQETTNRLNRIQKQESENEVKLRQLNGEIEAEQVKGRLLEIQREHLRTEGLMQGEAEANRVKAFLDGLGAEVTLNDKIAVFNTLRKQDTLEKLSEGTAQLYFTPAEVNLSIETRQNGNGARLN